MDKTYVLDFASRLLGTDSQPVIQKRQLTL